MAQKCRSVVENEIEKSEIFVVFKMKEQVFEIDIENPVGDDKKNSKNSFFIFKNSSDIQISIEERIYKLERDEAAFMQNLRALNHK